jgi:hypothetical protein
MSAGHNWLALWRCPGHQNPKLSAWMWEAAYVAVQGFWPRHSFPGYVRDFHHSMGWRSPLQANHPHLFAGETYSPTSILLQTSSCQPYWLIVPCKLEWLRVDLPYPNLFRFYVNYGACLPQCDYVHTFSRLRNVLWKFITLCFNRFCCNTSVNSHFCPFSVRNIVLMLNRV